MHLVSIQGCVSPVLALSAMFEADRQMCMKYVGAAGGGEAAALSLYPFTSEILTNMRVTKKYIYYIFADCSLLLLYYYGKP